MTFDRTRRGFLRAAASAGVLAGAAGTSTAQAGQHTVDMTDQLVFDPDSTTIAPGDTVVWENVGAIGHSVTAYEDDIPAEAEYFAAGGFDSEDAARAGYTVGDPESGDVAGGQSYEHTFEVEGVYEYFCVPHEAAGMVASLEVTAEAPAGDGDGGGRPIPAVSEAAKSIALVAVGALLTIVSLGYVFLKYGGSYGPTEEG